MYAKGADGTRANNALIEVLLCLPTAPALLLEGSGDFGTSPIYGQLSDKHLLAHACVCGVPGMQYNGSLRN
jgi:hypothetical protein